ncbi:hypothetical protein BOO29_01405 [Vibrio navarrensis]|jgi:uncharacterized lipoprotein NlpE involved in copper resistance|uniref:copper resistance protein NlpE n=1 Tax=Vibrio navarrensis TaxID=29495 RepID=UPI00051DE991|nr:copper resistance protein NlpE [Vibrio navarrensis]EGR2795111.1 copper resistance protein NlpE [Vibrio navarrensis]EJK2115818.1 copper resistance protein NlpE N-terminal domain-containing protein [Vibrio navarrensis]EJL6393240.1 copper resistance protein NlpE N-terminal domain-containing protein [Vibrio navarrensis]EJL6400401.1 copper resistance protein NlpE N-terminal domain-containing protein [Vibrio navarrensis]EJL6567944.1 copper resistance protein NlpE N-terminal domain-containing prot
MKINAIVALGMASLLLGCQSSENLSADVQATKSEPVMSVADSEHNARNSLDWNGTYQGTLPCADCEGIEVSLTLNQDGTYQLIRNYLGEVSGQFTSQDRFHWDERGSVVILSGEDAPNQFFVGENVLFMLDRQGQRITGQLADLYRLSKQ